MAAAAASSAALPSLKKDPILRRHISNPDVLTLALAPEEPPENLAQSESHVTFLVPKSKGGDAAAKGQQATNTPTPAPAPLHRYATETDIPVATMTRQRSESVPGQNAPIPLDDLGFTDAPVTETALERSAKRLGKQVKAPAEDIAHLGTTLTVIDDIVQSGTPQEIFIWMLGCTLRDEQFVELTTQFLNTYAYFMSPETLLHKLSECYFESAAQQQRSDRTATAVSTPKANLSHLLARTLSKGNVAAELRPTTQSINPITPKGRSRTDLAASLVRTRSKKDLKGEMSAAGMRPSVETGKLGSSQSGMNLAALMQPPGKSSSSPLTGAPPAGLAGALMGFNPGEGSGLRGAPPPMLNLAAIRRHSNAGAHNPNVLSAKDKLNSSIVARSPRLIAGSSSGSRTPSPMATPKDAFIGTDVADRALYVIEMWMEDHFLTFASNTNLLTQLGAFIHDVASASKRKPQGLKMEAFLRDSSLFQKINSINASARRFLLLSIGRLLRKSTPVKSMRKAFKKYKLTFKGNEACQWLAERLSLRLDEASVLMQRMYREGMIVPLEKDAVPAVSAPNTAHLSVAVPRISSGLSNMSTASHPSTSTSSSGNASSQSSNTSNANPSNSGNTNNNADEPPNFMDDTNIYRLTNAALDSEGGGSGIKGAERRVRKMDSFLDIEPDQAADAITAYEAHLLGLIPLNEFRHAKDILKIIDGSEKPPQTPPLSHPNLFNLAVWVRKVRLWVVTELTRPNVTPKQRYDLLKRFLKTANRCLELKNLNAVHEIALGLSESAVQKIPKLWDEVNQRAKYKDIWESLRRIFDPANDYYVYRPRADLLQSPALFSFSIHLRDLALLDDGMPSYADNASTVVNWQKMSQLSDELDWVQSFQSSSLLYPFEQSRHFIAYIEGLHLVELTPSTDPNERKTVRVEAPSKH